MCLKSCNEKAGTELANQNGLKTTIEPIKTIEELLKQEQERNAQLESTIYSLTSELKSYEALVAQIISGGSKVRKKLKSISFNFELRISVPHKNTPSLSPYILLTNNSKTIPNSI